jgi:hypothetical protein
MLDAGETLGHCTGLTTVYVPVDPGNAEYADIVANGYPIDPYVPPPEAEPQPLTLEAHPQGDMDATTMSSVRVYMTTELAPILHRITELERRMRDVELGRSQQS